MTYHGRILLKKTFKLEKVMMNPKHQQLQEVWSYKIKTGYFTSKFLQKFQHFD